MGIIKDKKSKIVQIVSNSEMARDLDSISFVEKEKDNESLKSKREKRLRLNMYNGEIGDFLYDVKKFELVHDSIGDYLHYIGDGTTPVEIPYNCVSCRKMFKDFDEKTINLSKINMRWIKDASEMFKGSNLEYIDSSFLDKINTNLVDGMFDDCNNLKNKDELESILFGKEGMDLE